MFFLFFNRFHSKGPSMPDSKKAPNESGLSQHIASATAKHYLDFALEVDFFCATEVLFFCEERFWATCFFEEGFFAKPRNSYCRLLRGYRRPFFAGNSLVFRAGPAGRKRLLALFLRFGNDVLGLALRKRRVGSRPVKPGRAGFLQRHQFLRGFGIGFRNAHTAGAEERRTEIRIAERGDLHALPRRGLWMNLPSPTYIPV